jgi:transcription initiation factor TFIIE subunit alpha
MNQEEVTTTVIENVAGHDVLPLIQVLKGKKNVSEFTIAEELKEEINTIRNKLYRLYDSNLVEFTRKKDKKKGWYIYYWTFVPSRIPFLMKEMKRKKLEKLKEKIKSEQNTHFFECVNKCMRLTFDKAVDFEFKCPECGSLMNQEDNAKKIEHIKKEIEVLEKDIENDAELLIEQPVEEIAETPKNVLKVIVPKPSSLKIPRKHSKKR